MDESQKKLMWKNYREKNKELLSHNRKQYYEQHKEVEKQKSLEYYYEHKDKRSEKYFERRREIGREHYHKHKNDPGSREERLKRLWEWRNKNRDYIRMYAKIHKHSRRLAGILTKELLQRVYEDNIKFFGTLTCVYCQKAIPFGEDALDHRIPISKGGLTVYDNLVIACATCNRIKGTKTWKEYFWRKRE